MISKELLLSFLISVLAHAIVLRAPMDWFAVEKNASASLAPVILDIRSPRRAADAKPGPAGKRTEFRKETDRKKRPPTHVLRKKEKSSRSFRTAKKTERTSARKVAPLGTTAAPVVKRMSPADIEQDRHNFAEPSVPPKIATHRTGIDGAFTGTSLKAESPAVSPGGSGEAERTSTNNKAEEVARAHPFEKTIPLYDFNPPPAYPRLARRRGIEGTTLLKVHVMEDGSVGAVLVFQSSGYKILDESAMAAVKKWRFKPALDRGRAVAMWVFVPVTFKLEK